jgi:hypothetical protein
MQLNRLLIATAALEASAGVALMSAPAATARLLLGAAIDAPGLVVARVAGAALFTTGFLCWVASRERSGLAARGLLSALLFYNVAILVAPAHANLALQLTGIGLWPVVSLHAALAAWCIACLTSDRHEQRPAQPSCLRNLDSDSSTPL